MKNTVMSPERAKGILFPKSPFAPPGLVVIVIYDRGLTPPAIFSRPFRPYMKNMLIVVLPARSGQGILPWPNPCP